MDERERKFSVLFGPQVSINAVSSIVVALFGRKNLYLNI